MTSARCENLDDTIVVWITRVSDAMESLNALAPFLDAQDRIRAARYRFAEDRARFILGRSMVRQALGTYLNLAPEAVALKYTVRERPVLQNDAHEIQFSISHSHDLVAVALTAHASVGLDIEWMQSNSDPVGLAEKIMSAQELDAFQALPLHQKRDAFFRVWTRKEAYLKARGEGITDGLQKISVALHDTPVSFIYDARADVASGEWSLSSLLIPADYQACVACNNLTKSLHIKWVNVDKEEVSLFTCVQNSF